MHDFLYHCPLLFLFPPYHILAIIYAFTSFIIFLSTPNIMKTTDLLIKIIYSINWKSEMREKEK